MKKKILVLEDEKEIAELYAKRLKETGYEPHLAFDGRQGLEKLTEINPDLILLDLNMPEMGGLEFYQHISDSKGNPKYPVLVLTGRADLETLFKDFHVEGFIIKPFEGKRLLKEVEIIFNKHYWNKTDGSSKKIIVVDDDANSANKILSVLSSAGFKTVLAANGVSGIEKIMSDPPDLAMVKLGLNDLSGDLLILRLQQIAKTRKTSTLLYVPKKSDLDKMVMEKIASKSGVTRMLEYSDPSELLTATIEVFREMEKAAKNNLSSL